jgi:hypothetical protein
MRRDLVVSCVLLVAGLGALRPAAADEPDRADWLVGRPYERVETFEAWDLSVEAYAAQQEAPAAEVERGWLRFLAVRGGAVVASYRVDVARRPEGHARLSMYVHRATDDDEGAFVAAADVEADAAWRTAARALLTIAWIGADAWGKGSAALADAVAEEEPTARHAKALGAYRALERAGASNPQHLGILRDALVAAQLLVPMEVGSDRGANLAFAWRRDAQRAFAQAGGEPGLLHEALRTVAVCALAEDCLGLVALLLQGTARTQDDLLAPLADALARRGQDQPTQREAVEVSGRGAALRLTPIVCAGDVPDDGLGFHRVTVLVERPGPPPELTAVWYSLSAERSASGSRWALYGRVGGSRRLLHLYGATEPDTDAVIAEIVALAQQALATGGAR